jgi:hypothetical protein
VSDLPEKRKCPTCEMPLLDKDSICPFCGSRTPAPAKPAAVWVARVGSIVLLFALGLPAALLGCCGLISIGTSNSVLLGLLALAGGAGVFAFVWWLVRKAWKE